MKTRALIVIAATSFCMGCANISTLSRTTTLPPIQGGFVTGSGPGPINQGIGDRGVSGLAIHLDAPQRIVFSKDGIVCAEPSPDALQAFATSQGLSVLTPSNVTVQLANAFSGNAGSIGLRTQSITLMREILYRICEASYGKKITDFDVAQLLRRSQDLTLGVLAIEQLSGAVKAQQVAIDTTANADTSANLAATRKNLVSAREDEKNLKDASEKADADLKVQKDKVTKLTGDLETEKAKVPPNDSEVTKLQTQLNEAQAESGRLAETAKTANANYDDAKTATMRIQQNLGKAMTAATAAASGETTLSGGEGGSKIDNNTAQHISKATIAIVNKIVNKDHTVDSCISLLNKFANTELEPAVPEQRQELKQKLEKLEADRKNVINEKNTLELEKVPLEADKKVKQAAGWTDADLAKADAVIATKSLRIGHLHEEKAILDQNIQDLRGISAIRELCMTIIQEHLERQKTETAKALSKK